MLLTVLVAGCAMGPSRDDPFEPMNRTLYQVHDAVDTAVVKPVAQAYIDVVPQFIRPAFSNVFNNIDDLFSAVNDLLQGKLDKFGDDLGRVVLNTGFGLGGLFDLASMIGIERGNEDFGQTFGVWGFPQGPYLFVPLFGPTTVRDGKRRHRARRAGSRRLHSQRSGAQQPVRRRLCRSARASAADKRRGRHRRARSLPVHPQRLPATAPLSVYDGKPPPEPEEP